MLEKCLVFWKSEPHYAYKHYASKRKNMQAHTQNFFVQIYDNMRKARKCKISTSMLFLRDKKSTVKPFQGGYALKW